MRLNNLTPYRGALKRGEAPLPNITTLSTVLTAHGLYNMRNESLPPHRYQMDSLAQ